MKKESHLRYGNVRLIYTKPPKNFELSEKLIPLALKYSPMHICTHTNYFFQDVQAL